MNYGGEIRAARLAADLTQAQLASAAGTAQTAISAYEGERKTPSLDTLAKVLAAAGSRLEVVSGGRPVRTPSAADNATAAVALSDVLALAETLPTRHDTKLRFPRLREMNG